MRAQRVIASLALGAAFLSCSGPPGVDGGALDSGSDAADVPFDSATDVPEVVDAPPVDWVPIDGFPSDCVLERAVDPGAHLSAHWESCGAEFPVGCEQLRFDGAPGTIEDVLAAGFGNGEARAFVVASHTGSIPSIEHAYRVLVDGGGVARGAWRRPPISDSLCLTVPVSSRDDAALLMLGGVTPDYSAWLVRGTLLDIGHLTTASWTSTSESLPPGQSAHYASLSDTTFAAGLVGRGFLLIVEGDRWAHAAGPTLPRPGGADAPAVVGHDVFYEWTAADLSVQEIQVATLEGPAVTLYTAPADRVIAFVVSDGTWIAWRAAVRPAMPGDVIDYTELWAAPYTTDPARFEPRLVRDDILAYEQMTIGDGYYAITGGRVDLPAYVRAVSLVDGSARSLTFPRESLANRWGSTGRPFWVTAEHVVIPAAHRVDDVPEHLVLRIPIALLTPEP